METIKRYAEEHRPEALSELEEELGAFSYDGLWQLARDLRSHTVVRGSWAGCPLSYKRGGPCSVATDRLGRRKTTFTVLWDNGWLTDEDVLKAVDHELDQRPVPAPPVPATV